MSLYRFIPPRSRPCSTNIFCASLNTPLPATRSQARACRHQPFCFSERRLGEDPARLVVVPLASYWRICYTSLRSDGKARKGTP